MMIQSPVRPFTHAHRSIDCKNALELHVMDLIDRAAQAGWKPREVMEALAEVVANQQEAYEEDPDPADD